MAKTKANEQYLETAKTCIDIANKAQDRINKEKKIYYASMFQACKQLEKFSKELKNQKYAKAFKGFALIFKNMKP